MLPLELLLHQYDFVVGIIAVVVALLIPPLLLRRRRRLAMVADRTCYRLGPKWPSGREFRHCGSITPSCGDFVCANFYRSPSINPLHKQCKNGLM